MTFSNRTSPGHQARTPTRRESASPFRPRDAGGGGPLELAQRANRGGGGAGRGASFSLQEILAARRSERANMSEHHCNSYGASSPAPPPPPCFAGWSPSPAIAGADEARPLRGANGATVIAIRHMA